MKFDRSLEAAYGVDVRLSGRVARLLAPNPGPFTFKGTGVYLVGAGPQVAIIDPGPALPDHMQALQRALGSRRVSHILVTHTHRDHSPAAAVLKAWSGAVVYGPPPVVSPVSADAAAVDEAHDHDFAPDIVVRDGMEIGGAGFTLECVATPGHTANHMCYALKEEAALFSGDHVMGWSTSVIAPPDGDMGDYMASLEKLKARAARVFYPTHGSPIVEPAAWLEQLIAHRRMRESQIREALRRGPDTPSGLAGKLYAELDPVLRPAAAQQILAHLAHLQERGLVLEEKGFWRPRI